MRRRTARVKRHNVRTGFASRRRGGVSDVTCRLRRACGCVEQEDADRVGRVAMVVGDGGDEPGRQGRRRRRCVVSGIVDAATSHAWPRSSPGGGSRRHRADDGRRRWRGERARSLHSDNLAIRQPRREHCPRFRSPMYPHQRRPKSLGCATSWSLASCRPTPAMTGSDER